MTRKATAITGGHKKPGAAISGWSAEIFIPYDLLAPLQNVPPKPGAKMAGQFLPHGLRRRQLHAPNHASAKSFHEFEKFGTLVFE